MRACLSHRGDCELGYSPSRQLVGSSFCVRDSAAVQRRHGSKGNHAYGGNGCGDARSVFFVGFALSGHSLIMVWVFSGWAVCLVYASRRGVYPYALLIASITPFIVGFSGAAALGQVAAARFIDITVGVLVAWVVAVLIWPVDEVSHVMSNAGRAVKRVLQFSIAVAVRPPENQARLGREARKCFERQDFLLKSIEFPDTHGYGKQQIQALQTPLKSLFGHALYIQAILRKDPYFRNAEPPADLSPFLDRLSSFVKGLSRTPDAEVLDHLAGSGNLIGGLCADMEERRHCLVTYHNSASLPPEWTILLFYLTETLSEIAGIAGEKGPVKASGPVGRTERLVARLFPKGHIDRTSLRDAVKVAASIVIASILWAMPTGNAQATVSAGLVANQGTQIASMRRLFYRMSGTLIGGALGFAYVAALHSTNAGLIGMSPLILLLSSYVGLGDEDWSYAGYTAGLCFILCISTAGGEPNVFEAAAHRMEGVVLGGMSAALVARFLFPFDYRKKIREIREDLGNLHVRGLEVIGRAFTTDHATAEEIWDFRLHMRRETMAYESIIRDAIWDRFDHIRKRSAMRSESQRLRSTYRHFFAAFAISKHLESHPLHPEITNKMHTILKETAKFLKTPSPETGRRNALNQMIRTAQEALAARTPSDNPGTEEGLFYVRILLHYINDIIEELAPTGSEEKTREEGVLQQ